MSRPLPKRLREKWDELIETEGKRLGLGECRPFLENKTANDIFYEGLFNGRPCVVKCSSKSPESIRNEYAMLRRIHDVDPAVFPEPFAVWTSGNGRMAFTIMEKCSGGNPLDPATDILRMAKALQKTGIVHRDCCVSNVVCGTDGHLKLIDFQFAIDRNSYHESEFMQKNPKYLYLVFGNCESLGLGKWNDLLGLGLIECLKHFAPEDKASKLQLQQLAASATFSTKVKLTHKIQLWLYYLSLSLQNLFKNKESIKWRLLKIQQFLQIR